MFKVRVLTALILASGLFLAVFMLPSSAWLLLCAALMGIAAWEWVKMSGISGVLAHIYPGLSAALYLLLVSMKLPVNMLFGIFVGASLFWCVLVPLWLKAKWQLRSAGKLNIFLGWALLLPAGLALQILRGDGWLLLAVMMIAWLADSFAYFSGVLFGRHKLAPTISPGKTWEGAAGAVLAVAVYCWFLPRLLALIVNSPVSDASSQQILWAIASLPLVAVSIVGDLLESLFKRQAGLKDSSHLLPGHGGVLDRIDSLLALLPVVAAIYLANSLFLAATAGY